MTVGGHHEPALRLRQQGTVVTLAQILIVKRDGKELVDQLRGCAATGAVRHVDASVFEVDRTQIIFLGCHAVTNSIS
jgi:hypothetical protein